MYVYVLDYRNDSPIPIVCDHLPIWYCLVSCYSIYDTNSVDLSFKTVRDDILEPVQGKKRIGVKGHFIFLFQDGEG